MKHLILSLVLATFTLGLVVPDAEARRFGGGGNFGMQRQMAPQQSPRQPAQQNINRQQAPAAGAQNRSWMGPIAGLAAGLGLAALFAHLGMSEAFGSLLLIGLMVAAAVFFLRMLARRAQASGNLQFASPQAQRDDARPMPFMGHASAASPTPTADGAAVYTPQDARDDFDAAGFARQAKLNFIRLQAAYDEANLDDIREFTTPEVFAEIRLQLADAQAGQRTDVMELDATVLEVVEEEARYIVSVRFTGLLREEPSAAPSDVDEIWHLVKDRRADRGWVVAGIQQTA